MAYNPLPSVTTGDLWTASNHNTYIRDNFAAGVPDIFTTKGDLAVASGGNAGDRLGVGSAGQVLTPSSAEALGLKWINNLNPQITPLTNTSWDGDGIAETTYTITINSFNAAVPNTAKFILVTGWVEWVSTSDKNHLVTIKPYGGNGAIYVPCAAARYFKTAINGFVPVGDSGQIQVVNYGAIVNIYLAIVGWF